MARIGRRLAMAAVGAALLAFYLLAAYGGVLLAAAAWRTRPPFPTTLGLVVALTLGFGYLSYRVGVARMLAGLDAVEVPRQRAPGIHRRLDDLAAAMDVERPRLLLGRLGAPNALVVGGGDPVVVVDRSLVRLLTADELETILAHELAHLESRDAFVQTLGYAALRTVAGLVLLALFPLLLLLTGVARALAWIAGRPGAWPATPTGRARLAIERGVAVVLAALTLLVLAHSRRREFAADARAAEVTGRPIALARALRKIERAATPPWSLLSPLYTHTDTGTGDEDDDEGLLRLFSTHPTTDERIERLRERADAGSDRTGGRTGGRRIPVR